MTPASTNHVEIGLELGNAGPPIDYLYTLSLMRLHFWSLTLSRPAMRYPKPKSSPLRRLYPHIDTQESGAIPQGEGAFRDQERSQARESPASIDGLWARGQ